VGHDRGARVWAAITANAGQDGTAVSLRHVVSACGFALAADGVALTVARDGALREPALASGPVVEELEELQFTLGQGPGMDAVAGAGPILVADLAAPDAQRRWPAFTAAAAGRGVRGMFAFPVTAGAALVGVLNVYRLKPGSLLAEELAQALVYADAVLVVALDERGGITPSLDSLVDAVLNTRRAQVHQATGMVAAQLGLPMSDALATLRAHAYTNGRSLADLAAGVLAREVSLGNVLPPTDRPADHVREDSTKPREPGVEPGGRDEEE
jgi:hypothetical protein